MDGAPRRINVIWINSSYWFSRFCAYTVKKIKCDWIKLNWIFNPREQSHYLYVINSFYIYIFCFVLIFSFPLFIFFYEFLIFENKVSTSAEENFNSFCFAFYFLWFHFFSLFFILWWNFEMLLLESLDHMWKKK